MKSIILLALLSLSSFASYYLEDHACGSEALVDSMMLANDEMSEEELNAPEASIDFLGFREVESQSTNFNAVETRKYILVIGLSGMSKIQIAATTKLTAPSRFFPEGQCSVTTEIFQEKFKSKY